MTFSCSPPPSFSQSPRKATLPGPLIARLASAVAQQPFVLALLQLLPLPLSHRSRLSEPFPNAPLESSSDSAHTKPSPVPTRASTWYAQPAAISLFLCAPSLCIYELPRDPGLQGRSLCHHNKPLFCLHSSERRENFLQKAGQGSTAIPSTPRRHYTPG